LELCSVETKSLLEKPEPLLCYAISNAIFRVTLSSRALKRFEIQMKIVLVLPNHFVGAALTRNAFFAEEWSEGFQIDLKSGNSCNKLA
jgi:hypothetical protein